VIFPSLKLGTIGNN